MQSSTNKKTGATVKDSQAENIIKISNGSQGAAVIDKCSAKSLVAISISGGDATLSNSTAENVAAAISINGGQGVSSISDSKAKNLYAFNLDPDKDNSVLINSIFGQGSNSGNTSKRTSSLIPTFPTHASTTPDQKLQLDPETREYADKMRRKPKSFSTMLAELKPLSAAEEESIKHFNDDITGKLIDIPVLLNKQNYDYQSLVDLKPVDHTGLRVVPKSKHEFYLKDIKPSPDFAAIMSFVLEQLITKKQTEQVITVKDQNAVQKPKGSIS